MEAQNSCKDGHLQPRPQVGVVMVPFPAQGHLNQFLHLAHLITTYGIPVHYAGSATHNRQAKLRLHGWDSESSRNIHFHDFQVPPCSSPSPNPDPSIHFQPLFEASEHLRQPIFQLLQQLSSKYNRIIVIHDCIMTSVVQDVKFITNAEPYAFNTISAFTTFFNAWQNIIPQKPSQLESDDVPKGITLTEGCSKSTPRTTNFILNQQNQFGFQSGRLYNTSRVIEDRHVQLLSKLSKNAETKHFVVGPLNPVRIEIKKGKDRHKCLEWLDKQETGSVIYISFGSSTSMTDEQITELASGLERSGSKFIWVLRRADTASEAKNPQLPEGFEERVKSRGMVVREWAPQLEILAHPSIGGFMSHCGWNSCMESISMGVPMAAWPMHTDQPRNAVLVTEVLRIGMTVRDWAHRDELVMSNTIENVLTRLMASEEGVEMRKRAAELGDAVRASVADGGTSRLELDSFISHITR